MLWSFINGVWEFDLSDGMPLINQIRYIYAKIIQMLTSIFIGCGIEYIQNIQGIPFNQKLVGKEWYKF